MSIAKPANTASPAQAAEGAGAVSASRLTLSAVRPSATGLPSSGTKPRHRILYLSFLLTVVAPVLIWGAYLFTIAVNQFNSEMSFSIRSEETTSAAAGLLGAITQISSGTAGDADILYEFIGSQEMIAAVSKRVDLAAIYRKPAFDPYFRLKENASIEELTDFWSRVVRPTFDNHTGIIQVSTLAFAPEDARAVNDAILAESNALVNRLSEQARQDAIRYATIDLGEAEANLRQQRKLLADFRHRYQIVDPEADVAGQVGLLTALQGELAQALVERDTLLSYVQEDDQRVVQATRRIDAISQRIAAERNNLGIGDDEVNIADVVGQYEVLRTDLEFASAAYTQALTNLAISRAEARRQSRYIATHIRPTTAQESLYPQRWTRLFLFGGFLAMIWGALMIFYYNIRDSR